jgi:hypothetical protein
MDGCERLFVIFSVHSLCLPFSLGGRTLISVGVGRSRDLDNSILITS